MKRLLRITSHAGHARYLATVTDAGWIVRTDIPSPYASGPSHGVYLDRKRGLVIIVETKHKTFDVFSVDGMTLYTTDELATEAFMIERKMKAILDAMPNATDEDKQAVVASRGGCRL